MVYVDVLGRRMEVDVCYIRNSVLHMHGETSRRRLITVVRLRCTLLACCNTPGYADSWLQLPVIVHMLNNEGAISWCHAFSASDRQHR